MSVFTKFISFLFLICTFGIYESSAAEICEQCEWKYERSGACCGTVWTNKTWTCNPPDCSNPAPTPNGEKPSSSILESKGQCCEKCGYYPITEWTPQCGDKSYRKEIWKCLPAGCRGGDENTVKERKATRKHTACCKGCNWTGVSAWSKNCGPVTRTRKWSCLPEGCAKTAPKLTDKIKKQDDGTYVESGKKPECCQCGWKQWSLWKCGKLSGQAVRTRDPDCKPKECETGKKCDLEFSINQPECQFTGKNPCAKSPCTNGGSCVPGKDGTAKCICGGKFTGSHCHMKVRRCPLNAVNNIGRSICCMGAKCPENGFCEIHGKSKYTCNCNQGFGGDKCQPIEPCSENFCQNGGECVSGAIVPRSCFCLQGFTGERCENGENTTEPAKTGKEYFVNTPHLTWEESKESCQNQGATLASFYGFEDYNKIVTLMKDSKMRVWDGAWIGLSDLRVNGRYEFLDKTTPIDLDKMWFLNQPDNNGHCLHIWGQNYKINDDTCNQTYRPAICEKLN